MNTQDKNKYPPQFSKEMVDLVLKMRNELTNSKEIERATGINRLHQTKIGKAHGLMISLDNVKAIAKENSRWKNHHPVKDGAKDCSQCERNLKIENFSDDAKSISGLCSSCKDCQARAYKEDPEKYKSASKKYSANNPEKRSLINKNNYLSKKHGVAEAQVIKDLEALRTGEEIAELDFRPYLNEEKLLGILTQIYPTIPVKGQVKYKNRRVDYMLTFGENDFDLLPPKVRATLLEQNGCFDCECEDRCDPDEPPMIDEVKVIVEFEGHHHYCRNSTCVKSSYGCKWVELEENVFELRIPYFIQLDKKMSEVFFGVSVDFSDGFPHGFISPSVVLPEDFCRAGEDRFLRELGSLPNSVSRDIVESLFYKTYGRSGYTKTKMAKAGSLHLWKNMLKHLPKVGNFFEEITKVADVHNYHKELTSKQLVILYSSPMLSSVFFGRYMEPILETRLYEKMEQFFAYQGNPNPNVGECVDLALKDIKGWNGLLYQSIDITDDPSPSPSP